MWGSDIIIVFSNRISDTLHHALSHRVLLFCFYNRTPALPQFGSKTRKHGAKPRNNDANMRYKYHLVYSRFRIVLTTIASSYRKFVLPNKQKLETAIVQTEHRCLVNNLHFHMPDTSTSFVNIALSTMFLSNRQKEHKNFFSTWEIYSFVTLDPESWSSTHHVSLINCYQNERRYCFVILCR